VGEREFDIIGNAAISNCASFPVFYKNIVSSELVQPDFLQL
jgi:hypothetical protein